VKSNKLAISVAILSLLVVVTMWISILTPHEFSLTFVDVGQGDGALLKTAGGRHVLIDAGPMKGKKSTDSKMLDYILSHNIDRIDVVIISHFHDDHYGGIIGIIDTMPVELLLMPQPLSEAERTVAGEITANLPVDSKVVYMKMGEHLDIGEDVKIEALYQKGVSDENEKSLVNMVTCYEVKTVFTGDIGATTESGIVQNLPSEILDADIVKVAHHGSKYSSSTEFYEQTTPQYAVISVGSNTYGHPTSEAMDRISSFAQVIRTDESGSVKFRFDKNGIVGTPNEIPWYESILGN